MIPEAKIIARFGKMPETSDEAKNVITVMMSEMESKELLEVVHTIAGASDKRNDWLQFGLRTAQDELLSRKG